MALKLPNKQPNQYTTSRQLVSGDDINNLTAQLNSEADGLTAGAGGTQALALQLASGKRRRLLGVITTKGRFISMIP